MNIILIGYRGCGKTTLGQLLAIETWKTFVDIDQEVCKRFGNDSVAQIWQQHGEAKWREAEVEVTGQVCSRVNQVIALGGGTLMQPNGRQVVESAPDAMRIYLRCDVDELFRRINDDPRSTHCRPALTHLGGGVEEIRQVLAEREPVYRAVADKEFDVTHVQPDKNGLRHIVDRCL